MRDHTDYEGQQLGNYRLMRLLGQGGFAEVYLAEHVHLKTLAAVKLLMARLAQDDIDKFRSEAQTIARLTHPNIVRVLDFGVERNAPYLAMDYAPNGTIRSLYPKGTRIPLEAIITYVKQIAEALQYAHDQHLIHRDVKPENMLLGRNNEVLLSDFGIALVTQSSRYPTSTQDVAGTISYMAPEQIQAHPRPASDQYSLGIVVYEWLSGNRPFQGSFTEIAVKHSVTPPPPLRNQLPSLSPAIESVVMTALNKDPGQRFPTIRVFAQALQEASLVGAESGASSFSTNIIAPSPYANVAPPPSPYGSATPQSPSSYANVAPQPSSPYANVAPPPPPLTLISSSKPHMEPNPLALQYNPAAASNTPLYAYGTPAHAPYATSSPYPPMTTPPQRQPQKRVDRRTLIVGMVGLAAASSGLTWFIFSRQSTPGPTLSSLIPGSGSNPFLPSGTSSQALLTYSEHTDYIWGVRWSPDGQLIASCSKDGTARVWSADKGQRTLSYRSNIKPARSDDWANGVAWSPDSKRIAITFFDGTTQIVDVASGNALASYTASTASLYGLTWSPDGRYIAVGGFDDDIWIYDVSTGNQIVTLKGHSDTVMSLAWSPNGKYIASGAQDGKAKVWDPMSGQELVNYTAHTDDIRAVAWSPDSKRVVSGSWDGTAHIWDATTANTLYKYTKHTGGMVNAVAWSPDGTLIASGGNDVNTHIWNASTGDTTNQFYTFAIYGVSWSPDGTRIVTGGYNKVALVWKVK